MPKFLWPEFFKKNRRWIIGGAAIVLCLGGLAWQLMSTDGVVKANCEKTGGVWKDSFCLYQSG